MRAAQTIDRALGSPGTRAALLDDYSALYRTGYDSYTRLISAYYESGYRLGSYLARQGFSIDGDQYFARILSGDFWSNTTRSSSGCASRAAGTRTRRSSG